LIINFREDTRTFVCTQLIASRPRGLSFKFELFDDLLGIVSFYDALVLF